MTDIFQQAQVVANYGSLVTVAMEDGSLLSCKCKKKSLRPLCGDWISIQFTKQQEWLVDSIAPRKSLLTRHSYQKTERPLAANITQMIVVNAPEPGFDLQLTDHYLIAAKSIPVQAALLINKLDLATSPWQETFSLYEQIGYPVIGTSCKAGDGMKSLADLLHNQTSILVGKSGVGKSSLIKKLLPDLEIRIGALSSASGEGKHTTTTTTLYRLPDQQGSIIDSPGVRQFGLWDYSPEELLRGFVEFGSQETQCKFSDCKHHKEPGCAIRKAVDDGRIAQSRYKHYLQLLLNQSAR